jgi:hypothetical protein
MKLSRNRPALLALVLGTVSLSVSSFHALGADDNYINRRVRTGLKSSPRAFYSPVGLASEWREPGLNRGQPGSQSE